MPAVYPSAREKRWLERVKSGVLSIMAEAGKSFDEDYMSMLKSFRVRELQELLRSFRASCSGRKTYLLKRCVTLLDSRDHRSEVKKKIKAISAKMSPWKIRTHYVVQQAKRPVSSVPPPPQPEQQSALPCHNACPDVQLKPHPFYQELDCVVPPTLFGSQVSSKIIFHLSPSQVQQLISKSQKTLSSVIQVLLRLCQYDTSCKQGDCFPRQCQLIVNGRVTFLPGYNFFHNELKKNASPIDITQSLLFYDLPNEIQVMSSVDEKFVCTVIMARRISSNEVLQTLVSKEVRNPEVSKTLVKEKLASDMDSEVSATSLKISLLCPLGKMKMNNPCRAKDCNHLQCFDAGTYLQMNERKARWVCPVCDKTALVDDLFIDGLFLDICRTTQDCTEVEFAADGSWHPMTGRHGNDVDVTVSPEKTQKRSKGSGHPVIDLTISSDEESTVYC